MSKQPDDLSAFSKLIAQSYTTAVEAITAAGQRAIAYNKAVYDVIAQPYPITSAPDTVYRETVARSNRIVELTVDELQKRGAEATKVNQELIAQAELWRETLSNTMKSAVDAGESNFNAFKEQAERQLGEFAKAAEEIRSRARSAAGI
jgi:hypothetical protein